MLKKLQSQKSNYNCFQWEMERKKTEKMINQIQCQKLSATPKARSQRRNLQVNSSHTLMSQRFDSNREMYDLYIKQQQQDADVANTQPTKQSI